MFNDLSGLPDVLMGDVFVDALSCPPMVEPLEAPALSFPQNGVSVSLCPRQQQESPPVSIDAVTSAERIARLEASGAQFFLLTAPSRSTSLGPLACDACGLLLKKSTSFIRCAECSDPIVDLCAFCFANGAEFGLHLRCHAYVVVNHRNNGNLVGRGKLGKLDWRRVFDFFLRCETTGVLAYADLERALGILVGEEARGVRVTRGGRGIRAAAVVEEKSEVALEPASQSSEVERVYLSLVSVLTRSFREDMDDEKGTDKGSVAGGLSGGPGGFNNLRFEFDHDYVPEAETVLAAVPPPPMDGGPIPPNLISLFEGYSLLQDERERRTKTVVEAQLVTLREFANSVQKKKKTDEREMFEKCKMFVRPVMVGGGLKGAACLAYIENLASQLTVRKRLVERVKRLMLLQRNGILCEDAVSVQFDLDRKKRNDLNARRAKVWTHIPQRGGAGQENLSSTVGPCRSTRGAAPDVVVRSTSTSLSGEQAVRNLPGGHALSDAAVSLCHELHLAPQHYTVIELAVHALLRRPGNVDDSLLQNLVKDNGRIFGTTRRYLLAAQGLPVSATGGVPTLTHAEMKHRLIDSCRLSFR